jgi:tripartite-type tricarboxylate transporter receptor subunit TctC
MEAKVKSPGTVSAVAAAMLLTVMALFAHDANAADDWPAGPITMVIPYAAGGSVDRSARILAPFLEKELKTSIVIENRPGASGQIGVQYVLRRPADANTILAEAQPNHSTPIIFQKAPYAFGDIEIVNAHEIGNVSLSVLADSPYRTFDDLHKAIKANPGKVSIAFPRGGSNQLMALLLQEKLGWDVLMVPFESGTPARAALLGGHVTAMTNGAVTDADMKPRIRSLALSTPIKLAVWPDSPYINDALKPYGVEITAVGDVRFYGFKKGTRAQYPERFDKFVSAYQNALKNPEYKASIVKAGAADETAYRGIEQSERIIQDLHRLLLEHQDKFQQQ